MAKKRHTRHRRQRRQRNRTMKGGAFSQEEIQQLQAQGFADYQIERLDDLGVSLNEVMQKVNTIMNQGPDGFHGNSDEMAKQVMIELLNENIFDNQMDTIPQAEDDVHDLDMELDNSFESQGTMDLNELNTSGFSDYGYTTSEDTSFGGKKRRRVSRKRGTRRATKKGRKYSTVRKTHKNIRRRLKHKGGMCFGNGVGANTNDPNFSIYNTNMLKLFPYKP